MSLTEDELKAIETRTLIAYEENLEQEQRDDIFKLIAEVRRLRGFMSPGARSEDEAFSAIRKINAAIDEVADEEPYTLKDNEALRKIGALTRRNVL